MRMSVVSTPPDQVGMPSVMFTEGPSQLPNLLLRHVPNRRAHRQGLTCYNSAAPTTPLTLAVVDRSSQLTVPRDSAERTSDRMLVDRLSSS